jgi:hypothetical protein
MLHKFMWQYNLASAYFSVSPLDYYIGTSSCPSILITQELLQKEFPLDI